MVLLVNHAVPLEGIHHTEQNVEMRIEGDDVGNGTLYITESFVLWLNPRDEGIQLEYKKIGLHAICRDLQAFPREHILCHYEGKIPGVVLPGEESDDEDGNNSINSEEILIEIRFIPENKNSLEAMFDALADCQTLHPDSDCQLSEDEFENAEEDGGDDIDIYNTEDGISQLTEQGRANLDRLNQMLMTGQGDSDIATRTNQLSLVNGHHSEDQAEDDQFQDADDMDQQ